MSDIHYQDSGFIYKLSGFRIVADKSLPGFSEFLCSESVHDTATISVCNNCTRVENIYESVREYSSVSVFETEDTWIFRSHQFGDACTVISDKQYTRIQYTFDRAYSRESHIRALRMLLPIPLECASILHRILSFHASGISLNGKAIAFTADSGVGKSTRANTWRNAFGAELFSGDRPRIILSDECIKLAGAPWDGKEQVFRNVSYPLYAVLDIHRSDSVQISELDVHQKIRILFRQCFIPDWDSLLKTEAISLIFKCASRMRIFRTCCGPDEDAAKKVREILELRLSSL